MTEELSLKRFSDGWSGEETLLFRTIGSIIRLGGSDSTMLSIKGRLVIEAIDDDWLTLIGDSTIVNGGGESQAVVLVGGPDESLSFWNYLRHYFWANLSHYVSRSSLGLRSILKMLIQLAFIRWV